MSQSKKKSVVKQHEQRNTARSTNAPAASVAVFPDDGAPFGTQPRRSKGPLIAWCVLYVLWFGVLLYFAMFTVGLK